MQEDNYLKVVCDCAIVTTCACELAQHWGRSGIQLSLNTRSSAYAHFFLATVAAVALCCLMCCVVKACRLKIYDVSQQRGGAQTHGTYDLVGAESIPGGVSGGFLQDLLSGTANAVSSFAVEEGLATEHQAIHRFRALGDEHG